MITTFKFLYTFGNYTETLNGQFRKKINEKRTTNYSRKIYKSHYCEHIVNKTFIWMKLQPENLNKDC